MNTTNKQNVTLCFIKPIVLTYSGNYTCSAYAYQYSKYAHGLNVITCVHGKLCRFIMLNCVLYSGIRYRERDKVNTGYLWLTAGKFMRT